MQADTAFLQKKYSIFYLCIWGAKKKIEIHFCRDWVGIQPAQ